MKHLHSLGNIAAALLLAAGLLAACSQDELSSPIGGVEGALPVGQYPLQIGSVTLAADVDGQPWTRIGESGDRQSSQWENGDKIQVQIAEGTPGTYTYQDGSLTVAGGDAPAYWASKADGQSIRAWHTSSGSGTVGLDNQINSLAYVLTALATANFNTQVSLRFTHALAKVRVKLEGEKAGDVSEVKIKTYTSCTLNSDGTLTEGDTEDFIPMVETTYNGETFWEANVVPGCEITEIKVNGYESTLGTPHIPQAAKINTITLGTKPIVPEDAREITGDISDDGNYVVKGDRTEQINITGGSPNIYLKDANINTSSGIINAINITDGNPTIHVVGESNSVSASACAGIFVAENSTVTIVGHKREDRLTVRGGEAGSGIGGHSRGDCGNIHIKNVTIEAHGSRRIGYGISAGIGGSCGRSCGNITIDNATVHAYGESLYGVMYTPGIGCGLPDAGYPTSIPVVTISDSEIHAHRGGSGGNADYIGWGSDQDSTPANSTINLGGGTCTGSIVYCYTGDTLDKTVEYDAGGNETEQ